MKKKFTIRLEVGRLEKLRTYAAYKRKPMTQLVEDWIDRLPQQNDRIEVQEDTRD